MEGKNILEVGSRERKVLAEAVDRDSGVGSNVLEGLPVMVVVVVVTMTTCYCGGGLDQKSRLATTSWPSSSS